MPYCPSCGAPVGAADAPCSACGTAPPVSRVPPNESLVAALPLDVAPRCVVHEDAAAIAVCPDCAEPYCAQCISGEPGARCRSCEPEPRSRVFGSLTGPGADPAQAASLAREALYMALFSIVCLGPILAPVALSKAHKAQKLLGGTRVEGVSGKIIAASIIASLVLVVWVMNLLVRLNQEL